MANLLAVQTRISLSKQGSLLNPTASTALRIALREYSINDGTEYLQKSIVPTMHYQKSLPRLVATPLQLNLKMISSTNIIFLIRVIVCYDGLN